MIIEQRHEIPLTTAINKSAPGRGAIVESLYRECLNLFNNVPTKTSGVTRQRSQLQAKNGTHVTASVTDDPTGYFVQLTGLFDGTEKKDGPYLVFGKKFLEESKNPQLANTGVRLWA